MKNLLDLLNTFSGHGERTAMVYRTGVRRIPLTYAGLHRLALRMNSWLSVRGIREGDRVLIWGPNSPWWGVAFWGIIARGAVAVPVDFMSGRDRAEFIASVTGAKLIVRSRYKLEGVTGLEAVDMEDLEFILGEVEPLASLSSPSPGDMAQIIFTSGTTGNPKGVVLTHGNLTANLWQVNSHIPVVTGEFNFLSLLPLSHMFEQMGGFFTPLLHGASIVYIRTLKPSAIMEALAEEEIYAVIVVPRLLQLLKGAIELEVESRGMGQIFTKLLAATEGLPASFRGVLFFPVRRRFGGNFSFFVSGGAPLNPELFRFWKGIGFPVVEGYGLTECSPVLAANTERKQVEGSVGTPLPGVGIRIRDGEIQARGDNIFPCYYINEEATRDAFTSDGWFRTGDLGEIDSSGLLRVKGRSKELIVTGAGINVYPDGIEEELNRSAGIREACVIGLDRGVGEEVHAVLLLDGSGIKPEEIIGVVNARLDPLARITGFSLWPDTEFPKTATMKIMKYQVKERIRRGEGGERETAVADRLIAIISRVTGTPAAEIGEESLLTGEVGLTSIGRLELVNSLEEEFRLDMDDSQIDRDTTVGELRRIVGRREMLKESGHYRFWTNSSPVRWTRMGFDLILHYPLFRAFVRLETAGLDHLREADSPLFFAANHTSYLDQPTVMFALPRRLRYRTATAAWAEFFFRNWENIAQWIWKRLCYEYGSFALNLFPLPQEGGVSGVLRFMGRLADDGSSILLFPEGRRSPNGKMLPFRKGLGIMVKELGLPVVPVYISGLEHVLPPRACWPKKGRVTVTFGKPIRFTLETPDEITARVEEEVRRLDREGV
jgi:long-chain acyl-CoA synthetase